MKDYKAKAEENRKSADDWLTKMTDNEIKKGGSAADLARAAKFAKDGAREQGLFPSMDDDGQYVYTTEQGIQAACHAREDVIAILVLQKEQLDHLHHLSGVKGMLWICIGLLAYIAYKLS